MQDNHKDAASGLSGPIPKQLGGLSQLTKLNLSNNQLSGEIPPELGNLSNLEELRLANNQLEGELPDLPAAAGASGPETLGWSKMKVVDVSHNRLTGEIKLGWGTGPQVKEVRLRGNNLQGTIPADLFQVGKLEILDLGENQLGGGIHQRVDLPEVRILRLDHNNLTGPVGWLAWKAPKVEVLDLSHNQLDGHFPSIGGLKNLKEPRLDHNHFSGGIPSGLDQLTFLEVLDLSYNNFDRELDMGSSAPWVNLYWLNLSHNEPGFTGQIPNQLLHLPMLRMLSLEDNRLTGSIPKPGEQQWTNLQHLYLGGNQLTGGFPRNSVGCPTCATCTCSRTPGWAAPSPARWATCTSSSSSPPITATCLAPSRRAWAI